MEVWQLPNVELHDAKGHNLKFDNGTPYGLREMHLSTCDSERKLTPPVPLSCSCEKPVALNVAFAS